MIAKPERALFASGASIVSGVEASHVPQHVLHVLRGHLGEERLDQSLLGELGQV